MYIQKKKKKEIILFQSYKYIPWPNFGKIVYPTMSSPITARGSHLMLLKPQKFVLRIKQDNPVHFTLRMQS